MRHVPVFLALLLAPTICVAGGTLGFDDVDRLLQQKPGIRALLLESLVMPDSAYAEVRMGSHFTHLGGQRLGPYTFQASPKDKSGVPVLVTLCTSFSLLDDAGKEIPAGTEQAFSATRVREVLDAVVLRDVDDTSTVACPDHGRP